MVHVCFGLNDETGYSAKFVGTAMLSLFENISKPRPSITVHILHDNTLTPDNRSKFSYLAGRYGQFVKFYNVEDLCRNKIEEINKIFPNVDKTRFNMSMFYKFFVPQVLPAEIEKAIYLESHVIVNMDISELWRIELGDKILGVVPLIAIEPDLQIQDKVVADGFVKRENYFNLGFMIMNLKLLRGEEAKITEAMKFANSRKYFSFVDQTVLNYCFSLQTVKLSSQINRFVRQTRRKKESLTNTIYRYTDYSLQMDMNDPFNLLWMGYFAKTPWFNAAAIGRLYEGFQQIHSRLKKSMINLSVIMSGKTRAFCTVPDKVDELKKVFNIRDNEEIILLENRNSLQKLLDSMKKAQGKKIFFIMERNFPFNFLSKAGFVFGRDFLNGLEFLSEEQGMSLNSYPLLREM